MDDGLFVFVASPAYAYRKTTGEHAGMMFEKHLQCHFLAHSYKEAIEKAIAWAKNRYESYIKDSYKDSFFSSIKVYTIEALATLVK